MAHEFEWLNPPPRWSGDADALAVETGETTDFWRDTFYGFTRDSGHAWLAPVDGDFSASLEVTGDYAALYDQAGLMLRQGPERWIKAGIEFTDGLMHFSTVVTGPRSDWSVIPLPEAVPATVVGVRVTRHGDAARVQYALDGGPWRMARLAPFPEGPARVGPMACSPQRAGFSARFTAVRIGPPIARALHEG
jgi:regulation of enolase protein 1 (concanavalin A-like superfamily)